MAVDPFLLTDADRDLNLAIAGLASRGTTVKKLEKLLVDSLTDDALVRLIVNYQRGEFRDGRA